MTEPLMRRLAARGEQLTVGALPWVAPVYRAMPQVAEVVEFPFAHGGLQFKARRALARQFEGRFQTAYASLLHRGRPTGSQELLELARASLEARY